MSNLLLVGDIGGTNTRLLLKQGENACPISEDKFTNSKYKNLVSIVWEFLDEAAKIPELKGNSTPHTACFAVAGPVDKENNTCNLANLNWTLDGNKLTTDLNIGRVQLINDFEAAGYGVLLLDKNNPEDLKILQKGEYRTDAPIAVIGAGTGLGESFIIKEKVYPTEGGHIDFAARSPEEFALLEYIKEKYVLSNDA